MLRLFFVFCILFTIPSARFVASGESLVKLGTTEGVQRLKRCAYRKSFDLLSPYYLEDTTPEVSGVTSAVMVLNALNLTAFKIYRPKNDFYFTTDYFLSEEARQTAISQSSIKANGGVSAKALTKALEAFCLEVVDVKVHAHRLTTLRSQLKCLLKDEQHFVIGHFVNPTNRSRGREKYYSPIGAYDEYTDSILVMDVKRSDRGPYWIPLDSMKGGGGMLCFMCSFSVLSFISFV